MVDYSRWEALARDEERREQEEAAALKVQKRQSYLKAQKERADKIAAETGGQNHSHHHTCGCSMKMPTSKDPKDEMPLEQRNLLKIEAIKAAKTDGNRLFKENNLDLCLQVYERGSLICNGIYGITDAQRNEVDRLELELDLNIAQVYLKQQRWTEAISQCKMALQLDPNSVKAYYRMGLAYEGMGEYVRAREFFDKAREKTATDQERLSINRKIQEVINKDQQQEMKARQTMKQMAARIANAQ